MIAVIGDLHSKACVRCAFNGLEGCTVDLQEIVDNVYIEGNSVCCGCYRSANDGGLK